MTYYELYVSQSNVFSGFQTAFEKANYVVVGIPFDATSTFRAAARFAPNAIREASLNIETYSFHSEIDVEDLAVHDLGDLHVSADIEETLRRARLVVQDLLKAGKTPVILGGEHTVTLGCFQGLGSRTSETAVVSLDAHLDLRDEYLGLKTSHTTFMRRLNEQAKPAKIIEIGTRAVCRQELEYADEANVKFFTTSEIRKLGTQRVIKKVESEVEDFSNVYLTVDMDVLDPAYAPAVQNPEPGGLDMHTVLEVLHGICRKNIVALDLVEVAPGYDFGVTAAVAAKILFETLCCMEKTRRKA